jgi:hypothetical protein
MPAAAADWIGITGSGSPVQLGLEVMTLAPISTAARWDIDRLQGSNG